jgi:hypothetical protein
MVSVGAARKGRESPCATLQTPITVEDVVNSRMIACPSWKWRP